MKLLSTFTLLLLINLNAFAGKLPVNGQIITATDTVEVVFLIPINTRNDIADYEKLQEKITYMNGADKVTLKPGQAKEVRFVFRSRSIRMVSRKNTLMLGSLLVMEGDIFLKLEIDGKLKLFTYYNTRSTPVGGVGVPGGAPMAGGVIRSSVQKSIFQKGEEALMMPDGISFRSDMKKYLSDCPQLVSKFENKELKKEDVDYIVNFYNNTCGK
jgi:hypothetical protein